ncbi:hypothetical protein [Flavobacterium psychrophilum]|uniref:hypothetical protein n=1 Tax=Flavobacterium psychrophilum TaxID=96345 RepID=UPI00106BF1D0|nr:hypothetical protein [Flavobacterium psychrophilum]
MPKNSNTNPVTQRVQTDVSKSVYVNSLRYLLKHEDYVELNINQKINSKTSCFNYDRQTVY